MEASDSSPGTPAFHPTWTALGHRLAVFVGAGTALFALLRDVSVRFASLRGALAWLAVAALFRAGRALLERATPPEEAPDAVEGAGEREGRGAKEVRGTTGRERMESPA